jgi:S-ribosylhomocysteine lyase LuxS involved in autoinducer biosynthesis
MKDVITVHHRNIPFVSDIECGTMMFYEIESIDYTTNAIDSIVVKNADINNEEKQNFIIYFRE